MGNDRGHLLTEQPNERSRGLDRLSVSEAFDVIAGEDATVASAVARARDDICAAIELVTSAFRNGGRLIYVGAGTSGRLGVLDAAECPPTFMSDPSMVCGVIAGGWDALRRSVEGAEDVAPAGAEAMDAMGVCAADVVMGIATGGTTPYVHAALARARRLNAKTVFLACVSEDQVPDEADVSIRVLTGPEVITGSTRMKAGTATKLVLNTISTLSMVGIGKVHGNLMVDVNAKACTKLWDRGARMLREITGLDEAAARALLERADGHVKTAVVMHVWSEDVVAARDRLASNGGRIPSGVGAAKRATE